MKTVIIAMASILVGFLYTLAESTELGKIPWRGAWQPTPVFLPRECLWA